MRTLESLLDTTPLDDIKFTKDFIKSVCREMNEKFSVCPAWKDGILTLPTIKGDITSIFKEKGEALFPNIRYVNLNFWMADGSVEMIGNKTFPKYIQSKRDITLNQQDLKMKDLDFTLKERYCTLNLNVQSLHVEDVNVQGDNLVITYYTSQDIDLSGLTGKVKCLTIKIDYNHRKFFKDLAYKYFINEDETPKEDIDKQVLSRAFGLKNIEFDTFRMECVNGFNTLSSITLSKPVAPSRILTHKDYKYYKTKNWGIQIGPKKFYENS